jgi:predicted glutamine amidotransferase
MCRILGVKSKEEFEIKEYLKDFAEMSKNSKEYQGHGWGLSYLQDGKWQHYKNIKPIWEDDLNQFPKTNLLLVHARSAFKDEGIVIENNMPFYDDKNVFIFNGELRGVKIKSEGRIGAEKIFNYIKRFDKENIMEALYRAKEIIKKRTSYVRAMNIIIGRENGFVYSNIFSEDPDYFQMHKKQTNETIIVCSKPLGEKKGWEKISNDSIGEVN